MITNNRKALLYKIIWSPGQITITATITNTCDNSSGSISKTITAN